MDIAVQTEMNFKCLKVFAVEGSLCPCAKIKKNCEKEERSETVKEPPPNVIQLKKELRRNDSYTEQKVQGRNFLPFFFQLLVECGNAHIHRHTHTPFVIFFG